MSPHYLYISSLGLGPLNKQLKFVIQAKYDKLHLPFKSSEIETLEIGWLVNCDSIKFLTHQGQQMDLGWGWECWRCEEGWCCWTTPLLLADSVTDWGLALSQCHRQLGWVCLHCDELQTLLVTDRANQSKKYLVLYNSCRLWTTLTNHYNIFILNLQLVPIFKWQHFFQ